jgi:hypothetical protein
MTKANITNLAECLAAKNFKSRMHRLLETQKTASSYAKEDTFETQCLVTSNL